jgi:hypothetical protein
LLGWGCFTLETVQEFARLLESDVPITLEDDGTYQFFGNGVEIVMGVLLRTNKVVLMLTFLIPFNAYAICKVPSFEKFTNEKWTVDQPHYYDDSQFGFSFRFNTKEATGNLYVYDLGISSDAAKDWKRQFKQAVSDIFYRYEKQEPDAKLSDPMLVPNLLFSHLKLINEAAYIVVSRKPTYAISVVSMGMENGCFHKFRYTQLIASSDKSDVVEGLRGFAEIANSIHIALINTDYLQ